MSTLHDNLIVKLVFGSHLYGTSTPESDTDYKGIFLPTREQILLGTVPKVMSFNTKVTHKQGVKNGKDDVDTDIYSLPYFMDMACRGETVALDMLHAAFLHVKDATAELYPIWQSLQANRSRFYTKSCSAFVGYCRKQAAKYGIKGSRLAAMEEVVIELERHLPELRLDDIWDHLPMPEHVHKLSPNPNDRANQRIYQVCGKKFIERASVGETARILDKAYKGYGARARAAKRNEGIDWKAISHALRAAIQVRSMFLNGGWCYPLPQAEFLRSVKQGNRDYTTDVAPLLEDIMDEVEDLAAQSTLPAKVDRSYWDKWLIEQYERHVL